MVLINIFLYIDLMIILIASENEAVKTDDSDEEGKRFSILMILQ